MLELVYQLEPQIDASSTDDDSRTKNLKIISQEDKSLFISGYRL